MRGAASAQTSILFYKAWILFCVGGRAIAIAISPRRGAMRPGWWAARVRVRVRVRVMVRVMVRVRVRVVVTVMVRVMVKVRARVGVGV